MKIGLSEYEEGVEDGKEESAEIMRLQQSEIEALTAHIKNLTKGTIRQQQAEIEALKAEIEALKAEIEALKADNKKAYAYIARLANEMEKAQE
jgi:cell division protein FtsB